MRTSALLDFFALPRLPGRLRSSWFTGVVTRLCLLLLIILVSFAAAGGVANALTPGPSEVGQWEGPFATPVVGRHAIVLPTGKVLLFATGSDAKLWTPPAIEGTGGGSFIDKPAPDNLFCSGHCSLADGSVVVIGGHITNNVGLKDTNIFDPFNGTWTEVAPMTDGRWYPTCTTLPDGKALAISGDIRKNLRSDTPEVYDPATDTWTQLNDAQLTLPTYPWMFVLPSGNVFNAGPNETTQTLKMDTKMWEPVGLTIHGSRGGFSPAVMYEPGKILLAGGNDPDTIVTASAEIIDMNQTDPLWTEIASMIHPRRQHNATILPDGTIFVSGGTSEAGFNSGTEGVFKTELFDPVGGTWTEMASLTNKRVYHSTGFLLPDGRVAVSGTDGDVSIEIYSPPYLFDPDTDLLAARPTIGLDSSPIQYGSSFDVGYTTPEETTIASVALIRLSSVTHAFNMGQRYVPLTFTVSGATLTVDAPADANLAPPGYYMLFIVNDQGVPSVASFVKVEAPVTDIAITAVTAPASVIKDDVVSVDVTVENVGNQDVTSVITVTLTDTPPAGGTVGTVTDSPKTIGGLAAGGSTTLTFSWNTGSASLGDHTLTASHDFADDDMSNDFLNTTVVVNEPTEGVTVDNIVPNFMSPGTSIDVTVTGSGFLTGADLTFENGSGPAPTTSNVEVVSSTSITAMVTAKSGGPPRDRVWDVRVTNPDGSSGVLFGGFTVTP